eukprot:TRINITY_DN14330_c0_g1_i1.p1 TRINITY_DN14330_c0_g1~~TRINITY_DN14330_c0_g1_i1.p1  ORF type:complete len:222 (+),score=5.99 TRINITY_DN14330_c0_g1_i1:39-668(+)
MLAMYRKMCRAAVVFPCSIVVKDVARRDLHSREAREVHIQLDGDAEFGFVLKHPCRIFASRSSPVGALVPVGAPGVGPAPGGGAASYHGAHGGGRGGPGGRDWVASPRAGNASWWSQDGHREASRRSATSAMGESSDAGPLLPLVEDVGTSNEAYYAASTLFGEEPTRRADKCGVARGSTAAALAQTWHLNMEALHQAVRDSLRLPVGA